MNAVLFGSLGLSAADLVALFMHFLLLSLLAVGGAISTAPDMQRYLVGERGWLSEVQFTASVALAQGAPGPNVLFVAVIGWNIAGLAGVLAAMAGNLLPSTTLALAATRWSGSRRDSLAVRAFTQGMAPLTIGLLLATAWVLTDPVRTHAGAWVLVGSTLIVMLRTKLSPLWPVALGALVGALGGVG